MKYLNLPQLPIVAALPANSSTQPGRICVLSSNMHVYCDNGVTWDDLTAQGTGGGGASDATVTFTDITTNDVSITKHGFAPKLPNDATKYLDGAGNYSVPAGTGGGASSSPAGVQTTPDAEGDLQFWFKQSGLQSEVNRSVLAQMTDSSGNVRHATQSTTSKRGIVNHSNHGDLNAIQFKQTDNTAYATPAFAYKQVFIIARYVTPNVSINPNFNSNSNNPPTFTDYANLVLPNGAGEVGGLVGYSGTTSWYYDGNYPAGHWIGSNGFLSQGNGLSTVSMNGAWVIYEFYNTAGYTGGLVFGNRDPVNVPNRGWSGSVSEVLAFSVVKTGDSRARILQYLSKISKIQVFLP